MRQQHYSFAHRVLPHDVHHEASLWSIISSDRASSYLQMRWEAAADGASLPAQGLAWLEPIQLGGATVRVIHLPAPEDACEGHYAAIARGADGKLRYFVAERSASGGAFLSEWRPEMRIRGGDLEAQAPDAAAALQQPSRAQPWELSSSVIGGLPYLAAFLRAIGEELGAAGAAASAAPAPPRAFIQRSSVGLGQGDPNARRPGVVTAAAVLWIIFGALGLLGQLMTLTRGVRPQAMVGLAIAVAFIVAGVQTISGKAKDTLGNGIGAIVIGVLNVGFLFYLMTVAPRFMAGAILLTGAPVALGLVVGGILALVGRQGYREWRNATH